MNDLSMLQKRVYAFVKAFLNNYGYPPSVREIAKGCDIKSTSTVHSALGVLEQKGYISRDGGQSRSTVLTGVSQESGIYSIPLRMMGENGVNFGVIDIPKSLVDEKSGLFALNSPCVFSKKSIEKGDLLVVKSQETAEKGDLVVYDDFSLGIFEDEEEIKDNFLEKDINDLKALDGVESEENINIKRKVVGKVLVCIRHF